LRVQVLTSDATEVRLRLTVWDTGIGMHTDQFETIFQPFEQVGDMLHRQGGTGLGLAISREFVRLMDSDIHVQSTVGEGSAFWFDLSLPIVQPASVSGAETGNVTGYQGRRQKVLIVEDGDANRRILAELLSTVGFEIHEAVHGQDGLEKARVIVPDLILMDIRMPVMDGLEATRQIRQVEALKQVPIITISASATPDDERESFVAGSTAFLSKPVEHNALLHQISIHLGLALQYELAPADTAQQKPSDEPLLIPPREEMEALHRLAMRGNMRSISQHADHLVSLDPRYGPFAEKLRALAKGYQSEAVLELVEQYIEYK
ncbi:MAG TPA: response regulator, partial [Noviherbaspirillum sp.]|nr:response regulator [Noviherbaspirillum sp.]